MLAQPALVVLVVTASVLAHVPDGRTLPVLAYVPATPDLPAIVELGARFCEDGAWEIEEFLLDGVELELVGGGW